MEIDNPPSRGGEKAIVTWLAICALLVLSMVILGGITRLTHSGLSMVDWKPLMGVIPPLNEAHWSEVFNRYKLSPEYQQVNLGMSLQAFKSIFYFEYAHRVLGRLVGIAFVAPLLVFWYQQRISKQLGVSLLLIFMLGGLQGLLGWWMVQSGLVDDPQVSQYRLTAHLGLAAALFGALVWIGMGLALRSSVKGLEFHQRIHRLIITMTALIYCMILLGGLVAGLKAGLMWNTFPLMGDSFVPPGLYAGSPWYLSVFENKTTVQFHHRILAYVICGCAAWLAIKVNCSNVSRVYKVLVSSWCLLIGLQACLGVLTLLKVVPVLLASLHQAVALLIFGIGIVLIRLTGSRRLNKSHIR